MCLRCIIHFEKEIKINKKRLKENRRINKKKKKSRI